MYFGEHKGQFSWKISKDHLQFFHSGKKYQIQIHSKIGSSQKIDFPKSKCIGVKYKINWNLILEISV